MDHFSSVQVRLCPPKVSREEPLTVNDFWREMFLQARCPSSHPTNNNDDVDDDATECSSANPLQSLHVLHQEPIRIVPRQEHVLDDVTDTFLLEAEVVGAHHRRIDQIQSATCTADAESVLYEICRLPRQFNGDCGHVSALRNGPYVGYEVKRNIS